MPEHRGKLAYFAGLDQIRFRHPVRPGDTLRLEVTLQKMRRGVGKAHGRATVGGQTACEGDLLMALSDTSASTADDPASAP
jgi:3-hydroxyacyl-[acyl-carrier-protein] dehydratase